MFGLNFTISCMENGAELIFFRKHDLLITPSPHPPTTASALMCFFHAVKLDAVVVISVTWRGFEEQQQETLADLSSPALWSCRAVPPQSCIIAESVAKEPEAHAFS